MPDILSACGSAPARNQPRPAVDRPRAGGGGHQRLPALRAGALQPLKRRRRASVFVLADAALAACDAGLEQVRRSILADNAGHPYVAAFADEASENVRLRTRNMLAHSVNEAAPQTTPAK
jgi:hypothetical protein